MNKLEKELLTELVANFDDVIQVLTPEQIISVKRCIQKIYGNHLILMEGVKDEK